VVRLLGNRLVLSVLLFSALTGGCSASYIRMGSSVPLMGPVIGDTFILNVTLSNSGDEAARDVMVSLITPPGGISSEPVFVGTLEPNSGVLAQFKVAIPFKTKPGTYPLIIKTAYADANAYPFSLLDIVFDLVQVYAAGSNAPEGGH